MISNLSMSNYRAFGQLDLRGAARVNLIVGRNNSGKTSVLEAIRLLASGRDIAVLPKIAIERGEVFPLEDDDNPTWRGVVADVSHFFHGHEIEVGSNFAVRSDNGLGNFEVEVVSVADFPDATLFALRRSNREAEGEVPNLAIRLKDGNLDDTGDSLFPVGEDGSFRGDSFRGDVFGRPRYRAVGRPRSTVDEPPTVVSISPDSLDARSMATMWSQMLRQGTEGDAARALQTVDPRVREVIFPPTTVASRVRAGGILIGMGNGRRREPLGSMGDGMRRMLALSLAVSYARHGFLLVDEIDTGLHWSVMSDMWSLVIRAARELRVQVFATTHSLDCLTGLADAQRSCDARDGDATVFRIDRDLPEAVRYGADELHYAVEQDTEIRGR